MGSLIAWLSFNRNTVYYHVFSGEPEADEITMLQMLYQRYGTATA
ncbi:hypothetical protein [Leucothrix pacifica]|nr:hypothetical protein [Leucothrix pacifica]